MDSNRKLEMVQGRQPMESQRHTKGELCVWLSLFTVNVCTLTLQIAQLAVPEWVKVGSDRTMIVGGLLYCDNCPYDWSSTSYATIIDSLCNSSNTTNNDEYCEFFERLKDPGGYFIFIECISGVFLLTWEVKLLFLLLRRECLSHIPWLAYVHPVLSTLLQITSLSLWSAMTEAKYSGTCDVYTGHESDICVRAGPAIAIVTCISLSLTTIAYSIALRHYEGPPKFTNTEDPANIFGIEERKDAASINSRI